MTDSPRRDALARLRRAALSPAALSLIGLTALWALFFWRLLTPNPADRVVFLEGDFTAHFFPFARYHAERVWAGALPLWNPYNHAGAPFFAHVQWALWYPPRWITVLLAGRNGLPVEALQIEVAAHVWLASVLSYVYLRHVVRNPWAPLAGVVLYAYGGFMAGYPLLQPSIAETVAWLPLVLLCVELSARRAGGGLASAALGGLVLGIAILAGHPQSALLLIYMMATYAAFAVWRHGLPWHGFAWRVALIGGVAVGIAAVQVLPAAQFVGLTSRVEALAYAEKATGFAPVEALGLIWPQPGGDWSPLYPGAAGLLLAAGAAIRGLRGRAEALFWLVVAAVGLWVGMGGWSAAYDLLYVAAPGFSAFRQQERIAYLVAFALAALATFELDSLLAEPDDDDAPRLAWLARGHLVLTVGVLLVVALRRGETFGSLTAEPFINVLAFVALSSLLFNGWLTWQRQREGGPAVAVVLVAVMALDLFSVGMRNVNYVPDRPENRPTLPAELEETVVDGAVTWRVDGAAGLDGYGTLYHVPDIYGTGPLTLDSLDSLLTIPVDRFWGVLAVRYATLPAGVEPPLTQEPSLLAYGKSRGGTDFQLFELADARPFAWLVYDARAASGSPAFAREIMSDPRIDLREMAVTLYEPPIDLPGERPAGARVVALERPAPEAFAVAVSTPENALLTLAMPNYPGWQATVDGEPVPIIDTYAGLIGVPVRARDEQIVRLAFRPRLLAVGGIISALTLLGVLAGQVWRWRARRQRAGAADAGSIFIRRNVR